MRATLLVLFLFILASAHAQTEEILLNKGWQFRQASESTWLNATVPGTVHTDLLSNKKIPDPFLEKNELLVQWIDTVDWVYRTTFAYKPRNDIQQAFLVFDGLDTYAQVYLNDSLILSANNMFRSWRVSCSSLLKEGDNRLLIHFSSASKRGKQEAKKLSYTLPGDEKVFTRKAAYHYGWDWGPRFVTCGIWKPVTLLLQKSNMFVDNHEVVQQTLTKEVATLSVFTTLKAPNGTALAISVYNDETNTLVGSSNRTVTNSSQISTNITIPQPKWWWCNGYGEPSLYTLRIEVINTTTQEKIISKERIGLRTIELIQEADSIGKSFYFKLNGTPIFAKGANYIPPDNFLPRVTPKEYHAIVASAKNANMNMLRVWGGGVYAEDSFYDACDEAGILVWQDFMFACSMYPGDQDFLSNVKVEAEQQIIRLRNHASLALWCGNNEVSEAWHNWGWQKQYAHSTSDSAIIWNDYLALFEDLLPTTVNKLNPSTPYWASSPQHGWGRKQSMLEGDSHYWGVWWGLQPFSIYNEKVGRFMSEYGFQGMPSSYLFEKITGNEEVSLQSPAVAHHQKHPTGFQTIDDYLKQAYRTPNTFEDYRYISQLVQAKGMKTAIEAHRRNQPYCMGTLYWQLNDCWPVTSWSSIDSYSIPKAAHYFISRSFATAITSVNKEKNKYTIYVISDHPRTVTLQTSLQTLNGEVLWKNQEVVTFKSAGSNLLIQLDSTKLLSTHNPSTVVLSTTLLSDSNELLDQNFFYFVSPKDLSLQKPVIEWTLNTKKKQLEIRCTNTLAKNIFLDAGPDVIFQRNYFDLLPNQTLRIPLDHVKDLKKVKKYLTIRSVYDTFTH